MIPFLVISEIIILCLGATVLLYRPMMRVSEAICSGIIVALMTLSFVYQTVFLIGEPKLAFIVEGMLVVASVILLRRRRNYLSLFGKRIVSFWQDNKVISTFLGITLIYMGLQVILLPPSGPDFHTYHLPRVLLFQQEKSLFLKDVTTIRQSVFPVGWNILTHSLLRFYTDYGLGIFAFLIYLATAVGTYALARSVASPKISTVTTLAIISMPQVVMQATSMNTDSPLSGVAIFCILTLLRLYKQINIVDTILLILAISFALSIKLTFLLFVAPFLVISGYFLIKKQGLKPWINLLMTHWKWILALIFPVTIMSQIWLYIHNYSYWGGWSGPPDYVAAFKQEDGLKGGIANLLRYVISSIDLMLPTDRIIDFVFGIKLSDLFNKLYEKFLYPVVGDLGMRIDPQTNEYFKFKVTWQYFESVSWYGILGFLLSIPSIIYATLKGKGFVKLLGLLLIIFFLLVSYKVGWSPWRGRYFSLFFVGSSMCIAYTLNSISVWLKDKMGIILKLIIVTSLITLFMTIVGNTEQPLLLLNQGSISHIIQNSSQNNIWKITNFGQKREYKELRRQIGERIPPNSQLAVLADFTVRIYDYLIAFPNIHIVPVHTRAYPDFKYEKLPIVQQEFTNYQFPNPLKSHPEDFDYLLCLNADCRVSTEELPNLPDQLVWDFDPSKRKYFGPPLSNAQLFKLK